MTITGDDVITRLNAVFADDANAKYTAVQKLAAVNAAIDDAWPEVFTVAVDSSITLASSTYTYTPTAAPEGGFRVAYVTSTRNPDTLLRRVFQRQNGATWEIILPAGLTIGYNTQTLKLWYQARCARLDASTDTIDAALPLDYLWKYAAAFLAGNMLIKGPSFDVTSYEKVLVIWTQAAQTAKRNAAAVLRPLPQMIHDVGDMLTRNDDLRAYQLSQFNTN